MSIDDAVRRHDYGLSEQGLIGALLIRPNMIADAADELQPEDLLDPKMALIYRTMLSLWARGIIPDVFTISDEMASLNLLDRIGGAPTLNTLQANVPVTQFDRYAKVILDGALRRRIESTAKRVVELARDRGEPAEGVLDAALDLFASIDVPTGIPVEVVRLGEFISGEDSFDWLVPGLIERGDRVLVVAGESGGKSMMLRQIAVACSVGVHPFRFNAINAMRVLLVDLENPVSLTRRKVRLMATQAQAHRPGVSLDNMGVLTRPGGIDVTKRSDVRWLLTQLNHQRPDLVVCGPLYKMFDDSESRYEQSARSVAAVLDDLRTRLGFSLILETHAPQESGGKRNLRPIGSSLWLRWPEFVLSFAPVDGFPDVIRLSTLKGRDERYWPPFLTRGGLWPWTPCGDPGGPKGRLEAERPYEQEEAF